LRRVVVRNAAAAPPAVGPAPSSSSAPAAAPPVAAARPRTARTAYADRVVSRNDMVEVAYEVGGVRLTITGRAEGNAAVGQRLAVRNLQSGRIIDTVAVAPGQVLAGPAGQDARATQQFAAR
jgi:flagella basal body P-ring formation protein FlgA